MENAEVVITGIGMVTPLGATAKTASENWFSGCRADRRPLEELKGTSLAKTEVAVLPGFNPVERLGDRRMLKYMSDAAILGCVAAHEAVQDADIRRRFQPERIGLYAGTGLAAANIKDSVPMIKASTDEKGQLSYNLLGKQGLAATNPLLSFKVLANIPPCLVSILECIKGPNFIFTPWEGQTGAALREAWLAVTSGEVDCALAGGADNAAHPATLLYLKKTGILGELEYAASGASYIVMERLETVRRDGRRIYAQIASIRIRTSDGTVQDPLSERMGRTFAAAPAILIALASCAPESAISICGVDRLMFHAELRAL
jgi:3-oxoacyl-[acyl-carrier-protein] synthase II